MEKPRRRAAGRPAGPPNVVVEPPVVERVGQLTTSAPVNPPEVAAPEPSSSTPSSPDLAEATGQQHRRRQRPARQGGNARESASGGPAGTSEHAETHETHETTETAPAPAAKADPPRSQGNRSSTGHSSGREDRRDDRRDAGRDDRRRGESPIERSLRALVSTRTTQLPPDIAMRAREVAAPRAADLAAAERDLVIVRRYYVPPAPLANGSKTPEQSQADRAPHQSRGRGARRSS